MGIPVRYHPAFGLFMTVGGAFILLVCFIVGTPFTLLLVGALNLLLGVAFLTRPWFVVFDDRIEIRNVLGMIMNTHEISGLRIEVKNGKVRSKSDPPDFRALGGWLARGEDLRVIAQAIAEGSISE
jgi:hypothetical protein